VLLYYVTAGATGIAGEPGATGYTGGQMNAEQSTSTITQSRYPCDGPVGKDAAENTHTRDIEIVCCCEVSKQLSK